MQMSASQMSLWAGHACHTGAIQITASVPQSYALCLVRRAHTPVREVAGYDFRYCAYRAASRGLQEIVQSVARAVVLVQLTEKPL